MYVLLDLELNISFYLPYHTYIYIIVRFLLYCQELNLWIAILTQGGKTTNTAAEVSETGDPATGIQTLYDIQLRRRWNGQP